MIDCNRCSLSFVCQIIVFFTSLSLMCSCEEEYDNTATIIMKDGTTIKVDCNNSIEFEDTIPVLEKDIYNPHNTYSLQGFTVMEKEWLWNRVSFNDSTNHYGFKPHKTYYARKEIYHQSIPQENGIYQYETDSESMGLYMWANGKFSIGYQALSGVDRAYTIIYYIGYDEDGNTVNKYFPCQPSHLIWRYSLK